MQQHFSLGFSPCPNDTFIFDALVNKKIDTGPITFEVVLADVETLNQWALTGKLDICKISYGVLPSILPQYILLPAGGALGQGVGPLLVCKAGNKHTINIASQPIALPGQYTTANLLFSWAYPAAKKKKFMVFSTIEEAVVSGEVAAGVIIHENRFTYQQKGLEKIIDLGTCWEEQTKTPIPLGGIVMKKSIATATQQAINRYIQQSIAYSWQQYPQLSNYVIENAQTMSEPVMRQHINLYVNDYSHHLKESGKAAVQTLLEVYKTRNGTSEVASAIFLEE
jgi:1,4-dihydroxy-6-naphthoate synthase